MVLDELAARAGVKLSPGKGKRARTLIGEGRLAGRRVVLARPTAYMNESGGPVRGLLDYHSIPPTDLVVLHDELDIPFASVRLKRGGGEGEIGRASCRESVAPGGRRIIQTKNAWHSHP